MEPISVIIADDDAGMRLIERKLIGKVEGFELAGEAENGDALLEMVETLRPQVVFLDVDMPGKNGVECARIIQDTDPTVIIIFATAHDEYMGDAFSVYAFDYLVKPFKADRVIQTLERVRDRLRHRDDQTKPVKPKPAPAAAGRLMLRHREGVAFLDQEDILLVQREDRSTVLYATEDRRYATTESLAETEARLDPNLFFRCHKSYIINLTRIRDITPFGRWTYAVTLEGTKQYALITHEKYEELERMFG